MPLVTASTNEGLTPAQCASLDWLLSLICATERPGVDHAHVFADSWRSGEMARYAAAMASALAGPCELRSVQARPGGEITCLLRNARERSMELLVDFESAGSGAIRGFCVRPVLGDAVVVRPPGPQDARAMSKLERMTPVRRDDGTEVTIDHAGRQFERAAVVNDHRWLAAFEGDRMVAVQGVAIATAPIGAASCRVAYNHYSRSDPQTRHSGNLIHLVATLYHDIYPQIDQFISIVDVQNAAGLRLSFGEPWPTRVRRLFLPVTALAARAAHRIEFAGLDLAHAAGLLNATHAGMHLWVPRTAGFLAERQRRAPSIYGAGCWRLTGHAALAVWPSAERRIYRRAGGETVRTLALVLDYGFVGARGRQDLDGLLCQAARELQGKGISHIALFVSDDHPPTQWLTELAEARDTYAICAPALARPAVPAGAIYIDHIIF
jgi:hypothetical protein